MLPFADQKPTRRAPVITPLLIAANILVFLWQYRYGLARSMHVVGLVPADLHTFTYLGLEQVFISMFTHVGVWHLMGNMFFLWVFGDNVEDEIGRLRFLGFYLLCGVVACAAYVICNSFSRTPLVGASGAISGVLGAYLVLHPTSRFFRIPAWFWLLLWIGLQIFAFANENPGHGGVAHVAHVGGFMTGVFLAICHRLLKKPGTS